MAPAMHGGAARSPGARFQELTPGCASIARCMHEITATTDKTPPASACRLVISCEHGGHRVPAVYRAAFAGAEALLLSHRGWDPGALALARQLAAALQAPLFAATTTRLLVDLNRSIGHPQLFSAISRGLSPAARQAVIQTHYRPHRDAVEGAVARAIGMQGDVQGDVQGEVQGALQGAVVHVASHSFTPVLDGQPRRADVAWLYDPRRAGEAALARRWMQALDQRCPGLQLRRNYPYQGRSDGLTALLRKRFSGAVYVGIELEVNQRFVQRAGAPWRELRAAIVDSLATALSQDRAPDPL